MDANASQLWTKVEDRFNRVWKLRQEWRQLINAPTTELGTQPWIGSVLACWNEAVKLQAPFVNPKSPLREFNDAVGRMLDVYNSHTGGTARLKELGEPNLEVIEISFLHNLQTEYRQSCFELEAKKELSTTVRSRSKGSAESRFSISHSVTETNGSGGYPKYDMDDPEDDHSHECICGIPHAGGIPGCFYLIPELRPAHFISREKVEQRLERVLLNDRRLQHYVDKARSKIRGENATPTPSFGLPSASVAPSEIISDSLHHEPVLDWADSDNGYTYSRIDTDSKHTVTTTPTPITTLSASAAAFVPTVSAPDFVPASQSPVAPKTSVQEHSLKKSWIISASSTICVCNDKSRLLDFEPVAPGEKIIAHGQELEVLGVGKAELRMESYEDSYQYVTFPEVWLVPEYYTNIISLNALEGFDIVWVHRDDTLVMNDEPWCKIKRINGMHVLEYIPLHKEIM
ncbi:hypothetical protein BROUX41_002881 [Berkeleyomyces rouxiae]|uniref:uncharacterized protein n=1 Tax=Berkeleyomyces rouxiae TaxID=2035830 RepID=UPI003B7A436C